MDADRPARPAWLAAAFFCLMAVGFCFGAWGLPWYVRHLTQLALAGFGTLYLLITGEFRPSACLAQSPPITRCMPCARPTLAS